MGAGPEITNPWVQNLSPNTGDYKPVGAGPEITNPWMQDLRLQTLWVQDLRLQTCGCRT